MARQSIEQTAESLYRVREFHDWVGSNVLFPTVPDNIVHPLKDQLRLVEHALLSTLYDNDAIEYAAAMHKAMQGNAP